MERLGVIGGLGPAATARFLERIVHFTQAQCDQDHLDVTILNRPWIPDRTAYLLGRPGAKSFVEPIQQAARELEEGGCTILAIPCNTTHARFDQIKSVVTRARFIHMPNEVMTLAGSLGCKSCGILGTNGTIKSGIYDDAAHAVGIRSIVPDHAGQDCVEQLIYDVVKAGKNPAPHLLDPVVAELVGRGAESVVLGCTELSVIHCPDRIAEVPIIDALDVLAWRCVIECGAPAYNLMAQYEANVYPTNS